MKFRLFLAVLLMSVFTAGLAIAQEPAGAKDLEITGELWMGMGLNLTKDYGNATDLQLDRTQINFKKQVSEMFTGEVKIEAVPVNNINDSIIGDDGSVIGVGNVGYGMYLKSTKISAAMKLGPLNVVGKAGIIETPMGQFMEDQKGDYMFNLDGSEFVVDNTIETEYDAALGLDFTMGKLLEASFTMGHGDGYTNLGGKNAPDYKYQYTGRITVSPIEQLKVSAFFSMDDKTPQDEWVEQNGDTIFGYNRNKPKSTCIPRW